MMTIGQPKPAVCYDARVLLEKLTPNAKEVLNICRCRYDIPDDRDTMDTRASFVMPLLWNDRHIGPCKKFYYILHRFLLAARTVRLMENLENL